MKLVVSIDTEEDNWGDFHTKSITCENIRELESLQDLFSSLGVRPTYLVTYQVASDPYSAKLLKSFADSDCAEIGAHCHPWNTPPNGGVITDRDSMLCNLSPETQRSKIQTLTDTLGDLLGERPYTFRAGRWGYSRSVARTISDLGYRVDSSVTPYVSWQEELGPDFSDYTLGQGLLSSQTIFGDQNLSELVEVPATVGFTQSNQQRAANIHTSVDRSPLRNCGVHGLLSRLGVVNKTWLSPELQTTEEMTALVDALHSQGVEVLNLVFHSLSLAPGLGPFVRNRDDQQQFILSIRETLEYCLSLGAESATLLEFEQNHR